MSEIQNLINVEELGKSLKLTKPKSLIESARKYFKDDVITINHQSMKTDKGSFIRGSKSFFVSKEQASFLVSRSRGDTVEAIKRFNLDVSCVSALHRNETLFFNLVDAIIDITDLKLERQFNVLNYSVDGAIKGDNIYLFIEYNERQHKSNGDTDYKRMNDIIEFYHNEGIDVIFVNVDDTNDGIANGIKEISNIVHSDLLKIINYDNVFNKYKDKLLFD